MKFLFTLSAIIFSATCFYGQKNSNCDWVDKLEKTQGVENQFQLIQENFGSCVLVISEGDPVSSYTSSFWFGDVEKYISSINPEEVESLYLLREGEAVKILYGENFKNIVFINFINDKIKHEVQKRVIEQLKKKN